MESYLPVPLLYKLHNAAMQVRENAYAPFSNYKVGAALLTDKGTIYVGCNVESPTLTLTTHAEGNAIDAMIAGGERGLRAILFVSQEQEPGYPCALCRQKIAEVSRDVLVIGATLDRRFTSVKISDIYPFPFLPKSFR